ncbi:MAG: VanZ family protein [Clostridia bacterium]|nr:VanZ family protein [Clostridia bacterium]
MKKRVFFIALSILLMAAIFYFSDMPAAQSNAVSKPMAKSVGLSNSEIRKIAHFVCFACLSVSFYGFFKTFKKIRFPKATAFLATVLYAVADEIHQSFVPGRACELADLLTDSFGALVLLLLLLAFEAVRRRKRT